MTKPLLPNKPIPEKVARLDDARVDQVFKLICRGLDRTLIAGYAKEKDWTETGAQLDALIEAANARLIEAADDLDTEAELGKAIERLNFLYMEAVKVQDHKTALAIQKEINKILTLKVTAAGAGMQTTEATRPKLKIVRK